MAVRVSRMYGLNMYDDNGSNIGQAHDFIMNMEKGEIVRITTEPLRTSIGREDLTEIIKKKSVMFRRVKSVDDIIIVGR